MKVILRDYQVRAIQGLRAEFCKGNKRTILVLPTGGGKTTVAAEMIKGAVSKSNRVLFLAHRTELIDQASARLDTYEIDHGIIQSGTLRAKPTAQVQVASIQTLVNRQLPPADLVIVDESHRARSESYLKILCQYPEAAVIGLTATPIRLDGKGLGDLFSAMVEAATVEELIASGVLIPPRVFVPSAPDLAGIKTTAGDYNQGQLADVMDKPHLVGDIIEHWLDLAQGRQTVVFAASVEHSLHLRDAFRKEGVSAEHIDGCTNKHERKRILDDLANGRIQVVTNMGVLTEGWDCPSCSCGVLARPTKSLGLYLQEVGRIMRCAPGKTDAILLDHAGCTFEHGVASESREWELTPSKKKKPSAPSIKNCPMCYAVTASMAIRCPECGYVWETLRSEGHNEIAQIDGRLEEYDPEKHRKQHWLGKFFPKDPKHPTAQEKQRLYDYLANKAKQKDYAKGWIAHKYREVMGVWPRGLAS